MKAICGTAGKLEVEISYGTEEDNVRQISEYNKDKDVLDKICVFITAGANIVERVDGSGVVCHAPATQNISSSLPPTDYIVQLIRII